MSQEKEYTDAGQSTIDLPTDIYDRVEHRVPRSEFETVDEYVTFVLEEVLVRVEDVTDGERVTSVSQDEVETRLEALGYLG
ncbi:hypothetical protein [Natrinema gelatinilyticum]|uniref:hypothetical protein n=1 Tax=Natrinema gelatinilyticum TaxID=2961571 RepID=UPI0020C3E1CE|nr:hypothetical protein [Natrinema gelatinilyticum]